MSNVQDSDRKYAHVRKLIAHIHTTRNVPRPPAPGASGSEDYHGLEQGRARTPDCPVPVDNVPEDDSLEGSPIMFGEHKHDRLSVLCEETSRSTSTLGSTESLADPERALAVAAATSSPPTSSPQKPNLGATSYSSLPASYLSDRRRSSHDTAQDAKQEEVDRLHVSGHKRSKSNSICVSSEMGRLAAARRLGASFLHLHLPGGEAHAVRAGPHSAGAHLHIPTFTITAPSTTESASRKLSSAFHGLGSFALRRHSNTSLHRSESMVSLCFRTLSNFITEDNLNGLQSFLVSKQIQIDDRDENGTTALMVASQYGRPSMVSELLAHGADPSAEDNDGWTALLLAAKHGRTNICSDLLDHGANIQQKEMGGWTPLMWASYKGHEDVVSLLLEKGADVNANGNYHISSLVWAAGRGHSAIVERLLSAGARPNSGDKYGTTALVWAARRGDSVSAKALLAAGATPDQAGMYSWTALLQATQGNHIEIVQMLLEHKPNVNALDKDGCTALAIACKEGYYEISAALLNSGAYINIQDRGGDTCLIHAVKGGHRTVVEALLKKYADVDVLGKDRKTAVYTAVEKGHLAILKLLLQSNPDLELSTKDGDTPLLRAVRSRNADMVQVLLDKKARVNAADKKGDTCLHIAMRARSKAIVEILLRNPKHSQLLYRPNRSQETPYNIDMNYPKTILGQIFGARRLNTNEDNESLLGYELYSSALADMLSEPSLSMPITVGLYARWGSGKSFLLNKLREEMKNFARQWVEVGWSWNWAVGWGVLHAAMLGGLVAIVAGASWILSITLTALLFVLLYVMLLMMWFASQKYEWSWPYTVMLALSKKFNSLKLVLQVVFCHPPGPQCSHSLPAQPIRFHFTDQAKSSTQEGEASVIQMVVSLSEALENQYGRLCTRLYRAFRPKPIRATADWRWRRICCIPHVMTFELCFIFVILAISVLVVYYRDGQSDPVKRGILMGLGAVLSLTAVANLYTWGRIGAALILSPRQHIKRSVDRQPEGFLQALRPEVTLLTDLVKCLDAFTGQQTRLVVVVDALDSCEQDRVLIVLNAIHTLCSDQHSPFVIILAIDPHIISKAVEVNSRRAFSESNIGGWDYLKNMVQLPFYLQNSALRRVKIAQQTSQRKLQLTALSSGNDELTASLQRSVSARRLSSASEIMSSQEKLKGLGSSGSTRGARKLKISESVASSVNSNLHRVGLSSGPADLNRVLLTDDYFSDVNPRSMRRLMNVLYITGRLLKAFQIEFNWHNLASWVNLTEQWPFRTSWIILHHEMFEEHIEDSTSLKQIYDKVRPSIPIIREAEPLMELDRDERKLDVFLGFHRTSLLAADLKIFLPFTINLDPYIKKVIKDEQQHYIIDNSETPVVNPVTTPKPYSNKFYNRKQQRVPTLPPIYGGGTPGAWPGWPENSPGPPTPNPAQQPVSTFNYSHLHGDLGDVCLSKLGVSGLCSMVERELPSAASSLTPLLRRQNISGKVLLHCDLNDLKQVLGLNFGDWELFKLLILSLRELESGMPMITASIMQEKERMEKENKPRIIHDQPKSKPSNMEKQVTLEEQMICGALQTLNEEALEDVLLGDPVAPATDESDSLQLVLLAPGAGWQASSPPPSLTSSPQLPRKMDPSILKPKGSFKQSSSKKHVSINERGLSYGSTYGSETSLKNNDSTTVMVKFEDETQKSTTPLYFVTQPSQTKFDFDFNKAPKPHSQDSIKVFHSGKEKNSHPSQNEVSWQILRNQTDIDKSSMMSLQSNNQENYGQGDVKTENLYRKSSISEKAEEPENTVRRNSKSTKKRPSSLLLTNDDQCLQPGKEFLALRSRSAEDSTPRTDGVTDAVITDPKTKNQSIVPENVQSNSVELITRLKDKIFNKGVSSERNTKSGELESDDESTPLVSSERSSPSISIKAQRHIAEDKTVESRRRSSTSSTDNSSSHHSSKEPSPIQREKRRKFESNQSQKVFSPEKHDCNISDATISVEFSPSSDHSCSSGSHGFNPMEEGKGDIHFHDILPNSDEVTVRESKLKTSEASSKRENFVSNNSASVESFNCLLEPHSLNVISHANSDASLKSNNCLWRQDAVDDQDWKNPESSV